MSKSKSAAAAQPLVVNESSISRAYSRLLLEILDHAGNEISPLVISVDGFAPNGTIPEFLPVRLALDTALKAKGMRDVEDVAFTIFPQQLWKMSQGDRATLFKFYKMAFPSYQAMNRKANGRGLYFERLMMYGRGPCQGNQLEWILSQYEAGQARKPSGIRRSMLQATTFDPERDHTASAQLGFPCLQHITFEPTSAGLVVNAFYATQQLFDKAYGNYMGLAQLGAFIAHEMKMPFARLNVTVGVIKLERISKSDAVLVPLITAAKSCLSAPSDPSVSKVAA